MKKTLKMWMMLGVLGCSIVPVVQAQTDQTTTQTTTPVDYDDNGGPDMGWLGLVGLAGLMGLRRRPVHNDLPAGRPARA